MRLYSTLLILLFASLSFAQQLPVIRLTLPAKANSTYQTGTMTLTDTTGLIVSLPVKVKTHGATALQYSMKPSLSLKTRDAQGLSLDTNLLNIRSCSAWLLDAMAIDRICMRNRVAFDIWNEMSPLPYPSDYNGRNGTLGRYVELYMTIGSKESYYGIYCLSDKISRKLLDLKKPKFSADSTTVTPRGVLYKSGTLDISDQNTPGYFLDNTVCVVRWHDAWELKEPEDYPSVEAWQPLQDLYNALELSSKDRAYAYITEHCYIDNIIDYQLHVMALAIQDNWGNKNKYASVRNIQSTDSAARLLYTPWDLDCALGGNYNGSYYAGTYTEWTPEQIANSAGTVWGICMGQWAYRARLAARWRQLRQGPLSVAAVSARLRSQARYLTASGAWQRQWDYWQTQKYKPCLVEDLSAEVELIIAWYADRFAQLDAYFNTLADLEQTDASSATSSPVKQFRNGRIVIVRDGLTYDLLARPILTINY